MTRFGIAPIGWANDDIRGWGGSLNAEQLAAEARQAGFTGCENSYLFPRAVGPFLRDHGLQLCGAYRWCALATPELHALELERTREHIDFCAENGAAHALLAEGTGSLHWDPHGQRGQVEPLGDEGWERLQRGLDQLVDYGARRGVTICFHPHGGTAVEKGFEIERLLDGCRVCLCLETGHLAYAGEDPVEAVERWGPRIAYVHLKDLRTRVREATAHLSFLEAVQANVFGMPGQGEVDFAAVMRALARAGYTGWLVLEAEQDASVYDPTESALQGRLHIERLLG